MQRGRRKKEQEVSEDLGEDSAQAPGDPEFPESASESGQSI